MNRHAQQPPAYGWPQMLRNSHHSSYSSEKSITTANAKRLGINWMSPMRSADLGSPVSAYNATLGKTVVYIGDERGDVTAYDEATGQSIWSTSVGFGDSMRATPLVAPDGSVWAATAYSSTLYKLDGATGAIDCYSKQAIHFDASPMLATPPGGVPTIYITTNYAGTVNGKMVAIAESNCKELWSFDKWLTVTGAWATAAFGVDANGVGRVYVGTADPDATMYAFDAITGKLDWYYNALNPPDGAYDLGAGATVSDPGVNGFADGVLYFPSKYGIMYALNLRTGKLIWQFNFNKQAHVVDGGRSSAALYGTSLVYGMANGVEALDAVTGKLLWHYIDPPQQEVLSSPVIMGPTGSEVVGFGDVTGAVHLLRLTDGTDLYDYQTGNYITSSPAVIDGHMVIDSSDGFLYDFAVGGGNVAPGTTAISSPKTGTTVANPQGNLTVTGSSADPALVTEVLVSVQQGGPAGPWWNGTTGTWVTGAYENFVPVKAYEKKHTGWTFQFPVPSSGSTYQVFANTVDLQGQADRVGTQTSFTVMPNPNAPQLVLSTTIAAPGSSFTVNGTGFGANETVNFALQGTKVGTGTTNSNGAVQNVAIKVPGTAGFGPSALVATGQTSGKTTTGPVDITNTWNQQGDGAARSGYESNDTVLEKTLQATRHGYVARAWLFTTGAPVDSSPAIVAGSAYIGNDAGQFYAVDTASGAPLWSYTTPKAKPIHGSAAVDGAQLVFGSDDGDLYMLATATGNFIGSTQLDGIPTAPAIAGGNIYTATDNGSAYEVNENTGAVVWKTAIGNAVHAPTSVDLTAGYVIVADDAGTVTTLNATSGAIVRQVTTGGAITAAPIISNGKIFAGSSDGKLYVYDESTGAARYTYNAGAPIHALAATGNQVYVGDNSGSLTNLAENSGQEGFKLSFGSSPVIGIGASSGVLFAEIANGDIGAIKVDQGRVLYSYLTSGNLTTTPAIVDGAVYVGAEDGSLYAFTSYGNAPNDAKERKLLAKVRQQLVASAHWTGSPAFGRVAASGRAFEPAGPRDFALHVDRPGTAAPAGGMTSHGGPEQRSPRSYVIYWAPKGSTGMGDLTTIAAALRSGATPAGNVVDTSPYPRRLDDGAVQREIARQVAANRWTVDVNAQVFVVTGLAATASSQGFCGYHSAFDLGGNLTSPLPYAFVPHPDAASHCGSLAPIVTNAQAEMRIDPLLNGRHDAAGNEATSK